MRTLTSIDLWRRRSVTVLGTLLWGLITGAIVITHLEWTLEHQLQFAIPILLSLGLIVYGGWLARSELPTERITRIVMWSLAGTVVISSFATWEMYLHLAEGVPFVETFHELLLGGTVGAIVGGGIGYYDAQRVEQHQETKRAHKAISASIDGIAILDENGRYTDVNQAHADVYGYEGLEAFLGETWWICYSDAELATIEETVLPTVEEDGRWRGELTGQRRDGTQFPQEVTLSARDDGGMVCVVRDITKRKQRERELERHRDLFEQTQRMAHVGGWELDLADEELRWTDEVYRIHELPLDYEPTLENALDYYHPEDAPAIEAAIERAIEHGEDYDLELRLITANDDLRWVRARGEARHAGGETVMLRGTVQDITERKERERRLNALHEATRELITVDARQEVAEIASRTAGDILELPLNGVHLYDEDDNGLVPVAVSPQTHDVVGDPPTIRNGEGIAWQVFESGEPRVYDDIRTAPAVHDPETQIRSELHLPLGDHGVFLIGSTAVDDFDENDVSLAKVLAANVQAALVRAGQEQELRDREQELERQMDRMEFFNSILRHDVLNGMTVILGRAEFLTDGLDGDQLRDAETILRWSEDIVEIVQRVRATLDTLTDQSDIQLEPVELSETLREELSRVRETYPKVTFETAVPDSVHVRANELLSEVLGNIITNAVEHNETEGLCVSITASEQKEDGTAVMRIADNGKGIPDEAKETIFRRDATGHAKSSGSGFGLFFVDTMVESYGGDLWVEDNDAGGATFVLELPLAEAITPA